MPISDQQGPDGARCAQKYHFAQAHVWAVRSRSLLAGRLWQEARCALWTSAPHPAVAHAGSLALGCNPAGRIRHPGLVAPELLGGGSMWSTKPTPDCLEGPISPPGVLPSWSGPISTRFCSASPSACQWGQELPCAGCTGTARLLLLGEELSQQPGLRPDPTLRIAPRARCPSPTVGSSPEPVRPVCHTAPSSGIPHLF